MYEKDLALNNQQWLICHKTKPNPTKPNVTFTLSLNLSALYLFLLFLCTQ